MGSSFEDLDARSSKVKTVRNLNKRFSRYFVFKLRFKKIKEKLPPTRTLPFLSLPPHFNSCCDTWRIFKQKNKGEGATWREDSGGKVPFAKGSLLLVISTTATYFGTVKRICSAREKCLQRRVRFSSDGSAKSYAAK